MSTKPKFNPYEFQARQLKVHALITTIKAALMKHGLEPSPRIAEVLRASWSTHSLDFAKMAGVNAPSIKTWDEVCNELG